MVDIASRLVLERLAELSPDAGLEAVVVAPVEEEDEPTPVVAAKPIMAARTMAAPTAKPKKRTSTTKAKRPQKRLPGEDKNVRFLGGIWLV